ncbi:MAG TPA: hypothetical protein VLT33_49530 [Labilithrix sp.]|nr:hypothetical protein [Labilithrix sp.]
MLGELLHHLGREEVLARRRVERLEERADEVRQVFEARAQGRNAHRDHREPEVEVTAERAVVHLALEVAVRRRDDANVHLARVRLADAADLPLLEGAEQLRLHGERELAHLVEEHGAAVRRLEGADPIAIGPGERAADVAKELALHQGRRDRAAVDDHERLVGPRAALHDLRGDELLAGAALAVDEAVDVARRDLLEHREELAHLAARAGQRAEARHHGHEGLAGRGGGPDADHGLPDREHGLGRQDGAVDAQLGDPRAVERARVLDAPAERIRHQLAVEARDRRIVDDEIVRGMRADPADVALVLMDAPRLLAAFALDDQREPGLGDVDERTKRHRPEVTAAPPRRRVDPLAHRLGRTERQRGRRARRSGDGRVLRRRRRGTRRGTTRGFRHERPL